jgi:hypothetical protein
MKVLETRICRGPNLYALWPVIRLRLDLGELEWFPTAKLPGFSDRLVKLIPSLSEHTCSYGEPGGFVRRLNEDDGTWLGHVMEHVALELQCLAGTPVTFGKTRGHGLPPGQYHVVYSFDEEAVGLAAGRLAMRLIHHLLPERLEAHDPAPLDFPAELDALVELARTCALDPSTAALVKAAEERRIPWTRLDDKSLVAFGQGRFQRHVQAGLTSEIGHLAFEIASNKKLTQRILGQIGLPVASPDSFRPGSETRILVVGRKVVAVMERDGVDRTEDLHEDNRLAAERAAAALNLDVAGIDFLSPDVSQSYHDVGGVIVGVDAAPGQLGTAAGPLIDALFPPGAPSCIPTAAIAGARGKTITARMVGHILKIAGHTVGLATSEGVFVDGKLAVCGDMTGPEASDLVLRDPLVDAAVLETAHGGIARSGLGWRRCNVGAVLNLAPLGMDAAESLDELAQALRVVAEVAQDFCVLNADDERVAALAEHSPGKTIWVTRNLANERVRRHIRRGGGAVALEPGLNGRLLVQYQGEEQISLVWARQISFTPGGQAEHNIHNAMFAAAIASGLGVNAETIRQGLRTFEMPFAQPAADRRRATLPQRWAVG